MDFAILRMITLERSVNAKEFLISKHLRCYSLFNFSSSFFHDLHPSVRSRGYIIVEYSFADGDGPSFPYPRLKPGVTIIPPLRGWIYVSATLWSKNNDRLQRKIFTFSNFHMVELHPSTSLRDRIYHLFSLPFGSAQGYRSSDRPLSQSPCRPLIF